MNARIPAPAPSPHAWLAAPLLAPLLALLLALLLSLSAAPARADTALSVVQSFRGTYNFTGTEVTMRTGDNDNPCAVASSNTILSAKLSGIPSGATVQSALLYWAGSSTTPDYTVNFDGVSRTADRQYTSNTIGSGFTFFSGAVDVTTQVNKKGNGTYTFSGLTVNSGNPWCASSGVLGGFALLVIYSQPSEPFRLLNVYEGFQYVRNSSLSISLGNFNVPNPLPDNVTGRVGHITWEGDDTLSGGGEDLLFNGYALTDSMNPSGNQFNSSSNVNGDASSYGIDFDVYTLKPPIIQAGQSSATSTYKSGQDLVLLSAEVVAMPYVANADLALEMTRSGDLTVGATASYTIKVSNVGVDKDVGPITVVDTLSSSLNLVSASGSGWTCSSAVQGSGETVVTCSQDGPLAGNGGTLTPLTISVTPKAAGNYSNSAVVYGKTGDDNAANNSATDTGKAGTADTPPAVFTRQVCKSGDEIVVIGNDKTAADNTCPRFIGPVTAGDSTTRIYITAVSMVNGKLIAKPLSSSDMTVPVSLSATCLPNSGVAVSYAGATFDCKGTARSVNVTAQGNKPTAVLGPSSAPSQFFYADVGRVTLSLSYNGSVVSKLDFISRPSDIRVYSVARASDGALDRGGLAAANWSKTDDVAFAKAGEQFNVRVGAWMANNAWAPSFGKEPAALSSTLPASALTQQFKLDLFTPTAVDGGSGVAANAAKDAIVQGAFSPDQDFAATSAVSGVGLFEAKARWFEAGYLGLTPSMIDYLNTGAVGGPPDGVDPASTSRLIASTRVAGRFYPDHFETQLTFNLACQADMSCPATYPVEGATYSLQPFNLAVTAFAMPRNGKPQPMGLFRNVNAARAVTLAAVTSPLASGTALAAAPFSAVTPLPQSANMSDFPTMSTTGTFALGTPYSASARRAQNWGAPTAAYLRATSADKLVAAGSDSATTALVVNSATPAGASGVQYEDGLMVISGRLFVPNLFGSELLRMSVPLTAQYWNGSAWVTSATDSPSGTATPSTVAATVTPLACTRSFAQSSTASTCKAGVLAFASGSVNPAPLTAGLGKMILQAPGRGTNGSIDFTAAGGNAGAWLPSTRARATFGLYTSPLIYLREVY
ncbi:hypothetical protein HH212_23685 [Massilia forsythiae]|uniref:DUF11 domain-containing protein n=1 Tax=Massilia forsythiae TaxID=2728020 RepID=A0A7Z2ZUU2_9BURK|nr:DUF6701 domain-containing protein [Massilia forsythiae]QJE02650.1 hypothetical protein HH212_23685 [Massilia forsythiae]